MDEEIAVVDVGDITPLTEVIETPVTDVIETQAVNPSIESPITFEAILDLLTESQKNFLTGIALGMTTANACKFAGTTVRTISEWRHKDQFLHAEALLWGRKKELFQEVKTRYIMGLKPKAILILDNLLTMGLDWENLPLVDKKFVMRAIDLANNLADTIAPSKGTIYEELLFKARRVMNGGFDATP